MPKSVFLKVEAKVRYSRDLLGERNAQYKEGWSTLYAHFRLWCRPDIYEVRKRRKIR